MANNNDLPARHGTARRRFLRRHVLGRFAKNCEGATAIEFGMLAFPFLITLFAVLETGVSMTVQQTLVNATDDVARQIRTGEITSITPGELANKICERLPAMVPNGCPGLQVDLRTYTSFKNAAEQDVNVEGENIVLDYDGKGKAKALKAEIGGSGAKQTLRTYYFWPLTTKMIQDSLGKSGNGKLLLSSSQTWQNEAY